MGLTASGNQPPLDRDAVLDALDEENNPSPTTPAGTSKGGTVDDALQQKNIADTKQIYAELQAMMIEHKRETKGDQAANGQAAQI